MYLVSPDDVDEEEIDPVDLAHIESSSAAPIVIIAVEDEVAMEDATEDKIIPSLESDYSTEDEDMDSIAEPLGTMNLIHLEDGISSIRCKQELQGKGRPPDDIGGNEDLVHALDSCADRLMMNPSWNSWLKEMDIPVNLKE